MTADPVTSVLGKVIVAACKSKIRLVFYKMCEAIVAGGLVNTTHERQVAAET